MQNEKQEKVESKKSTGELKAERQSDATDDEVLREEESGAAGSSGKDSSPSPDGAFDEQEETDKAGPI